MKKRRPGRPSRRDSHTPLTRERIVEAALRLIDDSGLEDFSTRKLGAVLGCEAMSIYHHFPSKGELLDAIASRMLSEVELPGPEAGDFDARLTALLRSYHEVARRHPLAFPLLALRRLNSPEAHRFLEHVLSMLAAEGFDARMRALLFRFVGHWATGAALGELSVRAKIPHTTPTVHAAQMDAAAYPLTTGSTRYLLAPHHDAAFELGLRSVLEAIRGAPRSKGQRRRAAER